MSDASRVPPAGLGDGPAPIHPAARRPHRWAPCLWIGAGALALRLVLFAVAWPDAGRFMVEDDAAEYWRLGQNLANGHGFSQSVEPPYVPDLRRTPVFPVAVAAILALPGAGIGSVVLFNIAASVLTVIAVTGIGARLFGPGAGAAAGLLLAADLTSAAYAAEVLTEPLFTLLLMAGVAVLILPGRRWRDSGGLVSGLAALCRPIGVALPLALWPACRLGRPRQPLRTLIIVAIVHVVFVSGWMMRSRLLGGPALPSTVAAVNLYFHRAAYVEARRQGRPAEIIREEWEDEFEARAAGWSERERAAWLLAHGRGMLAAHPVDYLFAWTSGIGRMLAPDRTVLPYLLDAATGTPAGRMISAIAWLQLIVLYVLAVSGTAATLRAPPLAAAVPLWLVGYFMVFTGPEMYPRFRVPIMPALCLLAGAGAQQALALWRARARNDPE